jgi:hypothetical protein
MADALSLVSMIQGPVPRADANTAEAWQECAQSTPGRGILAGTALELHAALCLAQRFSREAPPRVHAGHHQSVPTLFRHSAQLA